MRKIIAGCLLTAISLLANAQESNLITSRIKNNSKVIPLNESTSCPMGEDETIPSGSKIALMGPASCKDFTKASAAALVEIAFNGKFYLMNKKNSGFSDAQLSKITGVTQNGQTAASLEAEIIAMMAALKDKKLFSSEVMRTAPIGIAIMKAEVYDESEVTEGTGFEIKYLNPTSKRIKYVTATVVGYNAVDDPVRATFSKGYEVVLKGVGPIEPEEIATYKREYAWHTDVVEYLKIKSLKVDYMDGTSKTITKPDSARLNKATVEELEGR